MDKSSLRLKIYGSRGSYSSTSGHATNVGVNTTCLRLDVGRHRVIFDAGSGIINLGRDLVQEMFAKRASDRYWNVHLFFTHMHIDHLVGFPYFAMLYMPKSKLHFFAPKILDYRLEDVLEQFVHPPLFPVSMDDLPFEKVFSTLKESSVVYFYEEGAELLRAVDTARDGWQARISCMRNYMHPKGGSFFYRIDSASGKSVVFASDTEGYVGGDQRLIQFAKGAEVLFHDAQYTEESYLKSQGFGHSTYTMACEVAQKAGVDRLLLFHHDPQSADEALDAILRDAQKIFPNTEVAREGTEINF